MKIMRIMFLIILFLPSIVWFFVSDHLPPENNENRILAEKPDFTIDNISSFPTSYEDYYNDHVPFRNYLIALNSVINKELFLTSSNANVQYGHDNWFFYLNDTDGNSLSTWRGQNLLDENQLEQIANNLILTRDSLRLQGTEFILFIAPNKEQVYGEYVPDSLGEATEQSCTQQLIAYLQENTDIRIVYPLEELLAAKELYPEYELYYKRDTHWNDLGAYIGTQNLLSELGIETPDLTEEMILSGITKHGDLTKMVNLTMDAYLDQTYAVIDETRPSLIRFSLNAASGESESSFTQGKTMLMNRDSFFEAMAPYLAPYFSTAWYPHASAYNADLVDQTTPDYFVLETVERYLLQKLASPLYGTAQLQEVAVPTMPIADHEYVQYMNLDLCNGDLITDGNIQYTTDNREYVLTGWALDPLAQQCASKILLQIGDAYYSVEYGFSRPDVASYFGIDNYVDSAFSVSIPAQLLQNISDIYFHVISADGNYRYLPVSIHVKH